MLAICRQPRWKGFFYALKAMAAGIVADEAAARLGRELKYSLLLGPRAGAAILRQQS